MLEHARTIQLRQPEEGRRGLICLDLFSFFFGFHVASVLPFFSQGVMECWVFGRIMLVRNLKI